MLSFTYMTNTHSQRQLQELIHVAIQKMGISEREASIRAGQSPDFIRNIKSGVMPAFDRVYRLLAYLGYKLRISDDDDNLVAFLGIEVVSRGQKGEITTARENLDQDLENISYLGTTREDKENDDLIPIPQLDIAFSGGHGSYPEDHVLQIGTRPFSRKWLDKKGLESENLALTRIHGDSMEPLLKDKDIVMLDQSVNQPMHTMPIAFRLDGELYIKLCQAAGDGRLMMSSANKLYDPIYIDKANPPADFAIIAAVVWHAHSWV